MIPIVAVGSGATCVLCYQLGWAIKLGAKRKAQMLMSGWFFTVGFFLCVSNLPFTGGTSGTNIARIGFGLLCLMLGARLLVLRWRADTKAAAHVADDKKEYDRLWEQISLAQTEPLRQIEHLAIAANTAADTKAGRKNKVTQAGLRGGITEFDGAYLGHLFMLANGWSSEFRQIIVRFNRQGLLLPLQPFFTTRALLSTLSHTPS